MPFSLLWWQKIVLSYVKILYTKIIRVSFILMYFCEMMRYYAFELMLYF